MEGIERIKERILEEARNEADKKIKEAEKRANNIIEKARDDAEQNKKMLLEKGKKEAKTRKARLISMAELEMKKEILATKQEMVEEAFEKAMERLKSMDASKYEKILINMILGAVETGNEEIILSNNYLDKLSADFLKKLNNSGKKKLNLKLSGEKREFAGGFILKSKGIEVNNTFESIIRMEKDNIESQIAGILFRD